MPLVSMRQLLDEAAKGGYGVGAFNVNDMEQIQAIMIAAKETKSPVMAFLLICAAWVFVAGYTSINAVVKAELFPTKIRALGVGLPYAITVSVFGGTAPAIALNFKNLGHEDWFYYYLSGIICLSLIIYATMRDTKHESAMHRHE